MTNHEQNGQREKATRNSMKTMPLPDCHARVQLNRIFTADEYERASYGFESRSMDDHWFIYLEPDQNVLYFHRSWTGFCIAEVHLRRLNGGVFEVSEMLVNRDPTQYNQDDDVYDALLISWLIDKFLLVKDTPFPLPPNRQGVRRSMAR